VAEIPDASLAAARAAGLRYTHTDRPGITRRRAGRGWSFRDAQGEVIRDEQRLRRIRALVIPPAWTDVWINPDPLGHIQATGRDARGRRQYRYHDKWRETRDETKFAHMIAFGEALPRLRERVSADLGTPGLSRAKVLATVTRLLEESLIRVGNVEYERQNDSYGLTTLHTSHVDVSGSTMRFTYRGKSGKEHEVDVRDRRVAGVVKRLQDLPGQHLFQYLDEAGEAQSIDSDAVNAYLQEIAGKAITAKDFRTWAGTVLAATALRTMGPAETKTALNANIIAAVDEVAARLGNTRAVCRASYIHPAILHGYARGALGDVTCAADGDPALTPDERWTLAYLRVEESRSREASRQVTSRKSEASSQ
jgi:DNA topoisomerase-1